MLNFILLLATRLFEVSPTHLNNQNTRKHLKPFGFFCSLLFCMLGNSSLVYAKVDSLPNNSVTFSKKVSLDSSSAMVEAHFNDIVVKIDSTLLLDQKRLKSDSSHLQNFVDSNILPHWNADLTLKQLLGSKNWKSFTKTDIESLQLIFNETLHRYVQEGMDYYDGQRIKLLKVELNKKQTRGLVTIQLQPVYLPAFNIIFKISRKKSSSDKNWLLYDILVEGISYVKTKKNEYRRLVATRGVKGLIAYLDEKNKPLQTSSKIQSQTQVQPVSTIGNNIVGNNIIGNTAQK